MRGACIARIRTMSRMEADIDDAHAALPAPPPADLATMALFLDVDGTLIDFAHHPDAVVVDAALPPLLRSLRTQLDGALAPLSGRSLQEVDALLGLSGAAAAGTHGAELRDANGKILAATRISARMSALRYRAHVLLTPHSGVFIEAKPNALALHYRNAHAAAAAVRVVAQALLHEAGPDYVLQPGNQVIELKPAGVDKGSAVAALMRDAPFAGRVPWVLGDDLTDEHAFAFANAHAGVSIVVGSRRPTAATYAMADPQAVAAWLGALVETGTINARRQT